MMEDMMREISDVKKDVDVAMKKLGQKPRDSARQKDVDDLKTEVKELRDENKQLREELSKTVKSFGVLRFVRPFSFSFKPVFLHLYILLHDCVSN